MTSKEKRRRVLVETSIWIAHFRDPSTPVRSHLRGLVTAGEAFVAGPIAYEVLQGTLGPEEFRTVSEYFRDLPYIVAHGPTWVAAAGMAAGLRRQGMTFPMTDLLIATLARENQCRVWSLDAHFESIPGVRLYRPPGSRPRRA